MADPSSTASSTHNWKGKNTWINMVEMREKDPKEIKEEKKLLTPHHHSFWVSPSCSLVAVFHKARRMSSHSMECHLTHTHTHTHTHKKGRKRFMIIIYLVISGKASGLKPTQFQAVSLLT